MQIQAKSENLLKKVEFYQSEKSQGKYKIPNEMKNLVLVEDQEELRKMITKKVNQEMKKEIKKVGEMGQTA